MVRAYVVGGEKLRRDEQRARGINARQRARTLRGAKVGIGVTQPAMDDDHRALHAGLRHAPVGAHIKRQLGVALRRIDGHARVGDHADGTHGPRLRECRRNRQRARRERNCQLPQNV